MKKLAFVLIAAAASMLGLGAAVEAYPPDYPPNTGTISVDPATPAAGEVFSLTFHGCVGDETVSFGFSGGGGLREDSCDEGQATVQFTAPAVPGTYDVGVFAFDSRAGGTFFVTIVAVGLPATGAAGVSAFLVIAVGLLAVGCGLFGVSQARRRRDLVAR